MVNYCHTYDRIHLDEKKNTYTVLSKTKINVLIKKFQYPQNDLYTRTLLFEHYTPDF